MTSRLAFALERIDIIDNRAKAMPCYDPGYTFVEKLQTISTKFRHQQGDGSDPVGFVRHYYDVYELLQRPEVQKLIGTEEYKQHKQKRFRQGDNQNIAENEAFLLSDAKTKALYAKAHERSSALYYGSKPTFAALSATAGFMVEQTKLGTNPFLGMKVRKNDPHRASAPGAEKEQQALPTKPPRKGFTAEEARIILTGTLDTPSHLISVEMRAARRWLPWLCAYSGARVNELTSLHPTDITPGPGKIRCMHIKPSLEKTEQWRVVPIHSHVIEQKFLEYVEERRKLNKPLFYDPDRSRGGTPGNPQFKKVAERIGEWVHGLGIPKGGVRPNHAWRHLFKSVARHVRMDREVEGFITGHRPKDSKASNDYGDRWIKTMSAEIERYPHFKIAALRKRPAPHKRHRRTNAEVALAKAAKEARMAARATRAPDV